MQFGSTTAWLNSCVSITSVLMGQSLCMTAVFPFTFILIGDITWFNKLCTHLPGLVNCHSVEHKCSNDKKPSRLWTRTPVAIALLFVTAPIFRGENNEQCLPEACQLVLMSQATTWPGNATRLRPTLPWGPGGVCLPCAEDDTLLRKWKGHVGTPDPVPLSLHSTSCQGGGRTCIFSAHQCTHFKPV